MMDLRELYQEVIMDHNRSVVVALFLKRRRLS